MSKTLLSENQIGKASVYGKKIQACSVSDLQLVEHEISKCLGEDFIELLKSKKTNFDQAKEWLRDTEFKEGDIVYLHGSFWIAIKDSQGQEPSISDCWEKGQMFTEGCFNKLWCDASLFTYMDIMVQIHVAPELSMPLGTNGWERKKSDKSESLSAKELGIRMQMLKEKAALAFEKLDMWIKKMCDQPGYEGCFDLYKGLNRDCCSDCGCRKVVCECSENCVDEHNTWTDFAVS